MGRRERAEATIALSSSRTAAAADSVSRSALAPFPSDRQVAAIAAPCAASYGASSSAHADQTRRSVRGAHAASPRTRSTDPVGALDAPDPIPVAPPGRQQIPVPVAVGAEPAQCHLLPLVDHFDLADHLCGSIPVTPRASLPADLG